MFLTLKRTNQMFSRVLQTLCGAAVAIAALVYSTQGAAQAPASAPAPTAVSAASPAAPAVTGGISKADAQKLNTANAENPYGLKALWDHGDRVDQITLIILVIMSVASWYVIITKFFEQGKLYRQADEATANFWTAPSVKAGVDALKEGSAFRFIAESGLEATKKHDGLLGHIDLNSWVTQSISRAIDNIQNRLQEGLAILATVGSTAPFIGLFGTVMGIYNALVKIGLTGQASIDKVAGPVGSALIMTAIGLAVAVPAVLGYNWLVRRNKVAMEKVRTFGSDLHSVLLADSGRK
jgi:biopolymer transport protein ExbB